MNNKISSVDIKYQDDVHYYNNVFELRTIYLFLNVVSVSNIEKDIKVKNMHELCFAVYLRGFEVK
jgi:hypothetical protein